MTTPADDERTDLQSLTAPQGAAGARLPGESSDSLPAGTRLHEFEIVSVIGQGGFGIVYLANDLSLDRRVAIKEYMPSSLATRTQAMTVAVRSSRHAETFAAGLRSFINEARLLAQFDHRSLLKVHRFWESHGTAYMVMPYYAGITFAKELSRPGGPPDEARLRAVLEPLLDALALMHAARCYHRDIAPDNILLLADGPPLLLDFGAARQVIGDLTQALTVILKTGYAPVEQYGAMPNLSQGPWTDLYALGSVVEFAITGRTPPQAVTRYLADKREPLAVRAAGRYSDGFLRAVDRSLAVLPKDRPQSVAEMRALLAVGPAQVSTASAPASRASASASKADGTVRSSRQPGIAIGGAVVLVAAVAFLGGRRWFAAPPAPLGTESTASTPAAVQPPQAAAIDEKPGRASPPPQVESPPAAIKAPRMPEQAPTPTPTLVPSPIPTSLATPPPAQTPTTSGSEGLTPPVAAPEPTAAPKSTGATSPAAVPAPAAPPRPVAAPPPAAGVSTKPTAETAPLAAPEPAAAPPAAALPPQPAATLSRHSASPQPAATPPAPSPPQKRATAPAAQEALPAEPRIIKKKLPDARCADIIQRVSLGEPLSDAEKAILTRECGP